MFLRVQLLATKYRAKSKKVETDKNFLKKCRPLRLCTIRFAFCMEYRIFAGGYINSMNKILSQNLQTEQGPSIKAPKGYLYSSDRVHVEKKTTSTDLGWRSTNTRIWLWRRVLLWRFEYMPYGQLTMHCPRNKAWLPQKSFKQSHTLGFSKNALNNHTCMSWKSQLWAKKEMVRLENKKQSCTWNMRCVLPMYAQDNCDQKPNPPSPIHEQTSAS